MCVGIVFYKSFHQLHIACVCLFACLSRSRP